MQSKISAYQTSDVWLQNTQNVLQQMTSLAARAADGSISSGDRERLDTQFMEFKEEVARVADTASYNGIRLASQGTIATWDTVKNRIVYSELDGTQVKEFPFEMGTGSQSVNGYDYAFEETVGNVGLVNEFVLANEGRNLVYVAATNGNNGTVANQTIMNLELSTGHLKTMNLALPGADGLSEWGQINLKTDDKGRVWVTEPTATPYFPHRIGMLDLDSMAVDFGGSGPDNAWAGIDAGGTAIAYSEFQVYGDEIHYMDSGSSQVKTVKQNIYSLKKTEDVTSHEEFNKLWTDRGHLSLSFLGIVFPLDTANSDFKTDWFQGFSKDNQYLALEIYSSVSNRNELIIYNQESKQHVAITVGDNKNSIQSVQFDHNNNVYWTNTGDVTTSNTLNKAKIKFGDTPTLYGIETLRNETTGHLGVSSGSNALVQNTGLSYFDHAPVFSDSPNDLLTGGLEKVEVQIGRLGLSKASLSSQNKAVEALAAVQNAIDDVSRQRVLNGARVAQLTSAIRSSTGAINSVAEAEAVMRNTDIAAESSKLAAAVALQNVQVFVQLSSRQALQSHISILE
jgi:flagellin-like hook-associated protein FlgL